MIKFSQFGRWPVASLVVLFGVHTTAQLDGCGVCAVMLTWPYSDVQQVLLAVNYSTSTLLLQVFASVSQTGFLAVRWSQGRVPSGRAPMGMRTQLITKDSDIPLAKASHIAKARNNLFCLLIRAVAGNPWSLFICHGEFKQGSKRQPRDTV